MHAIMPNAGSFKAQIVVLYLSTFVEVVFNGVFGTVGGSLAPIIAVMLYVRLGFGFVWERARMRW